MYIGRDGRLEPIQDVPMPNSLGMFYAQVTGSLGFRVSRHEGKVLGLAAYGKETALYRWLKKRLYSRDGEIRYPLGFANAYYTRLQTRMFSREDMAYAYQRILEETTTAWVSHYVRKHGISNVALVGGVAANVKNNQRVNEIDGVDSVFVQPDMGDGGGGLGAALARAVELGDGRLDVRRIESIYMGPSYGDDAIEAALEAAGLSYHKSDDVEREIAELVAGGEIVARFNGGMEFGPRALGNRTIIAPATDPSINKSLNDRLRRTEFMPFAPATRIDDVDQCYIDAQGSLYTAEFMTITFDCTPYMKEVSPAAVHVDGTARPQVVTMDRNPSFYRVITHYKEMTGIPSVINTSFNMHEEPIVCSPEDAVRGFLQGKLDNLAAGSYVVRLRDNMPAAEGNAPEALREDTVHESDW
jgi:carbamoyltransferase